MKILKLSVENVKRVEAVAITPDGNIVVVGGRNDAGKSSVLDAIMYGLAGGRSIPAVPLRRGQTEGKVAITLDGDDGAKLVVTRTFTEKGTTRLDVTTGDGYKAPTPQKILDDLCGRIAFDPLAFTRRLPKQQADTLRQVVGLDFTRQDQERKRMYDERTAVNRDITNLDGQLKRMPLHDGVPAEEVLIAGLTQQLTERTRAGLRNAEKQRAVTQADADAESQARAVEALGDQLAATRTHLEEAASVHEAARKIVEQDLEDDDIEGIRKQMAELTKQLTEKTEAGKRNDCKRASLSRAENLANQRRETVEERVAQLAEAQARLDRQTAAADNARGAAESLENADVEGVRKEIDDAEEVNAKVRANKFRAVVQADRDAKDTDSKQLTADIADIDAAKTGAIADADWPVEGLGFGADGVTLNELPFEQASQAERLRVSVAMGVAMNPKLRVQLIRDASLLDDESLAQLATLAAVHDTQLWLERVGEGKECSVVIEDGTVKGENDG